MEVKSAFEGLISKIQTLRGGGYRMTVDVPATHVKEMQDLFGVPDNELVYIAVVRRNKNEKGVDVELPKFEREEQ